MNEEKSSFIKGINEQHPAAYHQLYNCSETLENQCIIVSLKIFIKVPL